MFFPRVHFFAVFAGTDLPPLHAVVGCVVLLDMESGAGYLNAPTWVTRARTERCTVKLKLLHTIYNIVSRRISRAHLGTHNLLLLCIVFAVRPERAWHPLPHVVALLASLEVRQCGQQHNNTAAIQSSFSSVG